MGEVQLRLHQVYAAAPLVRRRKALDVKYTKAPDDIHQLQCSPNTSLRS